ncbi:helix-turn-helix domain-containing protein [Arthrobacter sp. MYb213]|uniref:winged helix-turn-helix transcriptional regulator n=1 Tax=Arthrobacter sp. MYb213 TaxID=1848595 RepID=UPI000CFCA54D|nr:helix-turn-helix domain-containing protein [Arthrobacter sp. MYb213]PRB67500.1 transcriptional regulator [Arthrobacter sp. MYb213]
MQWQDYDTENCSIQRTLEVVGEKWSLLILREAFNGVRRFDAIRSHLGASEAMISARLNSLMASGILVATPYKEPGHRTRNEYRLTPKGLDLYPIIISLLQWGDRYEADPTGPPLLIKHSGCGEQVSAVVQCALGHVLDTPRESQVSPGPGAKLRGSAP